MDWHVEQFSLEDEVSYFDPFWNKVKHSVEGKDMDLLKTGDTAHETSFNGFELINSQGKSAWVNWPSKYRFMGIQIFASADQKKISRDTYGLLSWIGDCGGLVDGVYLLLFGFIKHFGLARLWAGVITHLYKDGSLTDGSRRILSGKKGRINVQIPKNEIDES